MRNSSKFKLILGSILLLIILTINVFIAFRFYQLGTISVDEFYFWQAKDS